MTLKAALQSAAVGQKVRRTGSQKYAVKTTEGITEEETASGVSYLVRYVSTQNETVRGGKEIVKFDTKIVEVQDAFADELLADDWTVDAE